MISNSISQVPPCPQNFLQTDLLSSVLIMYIINNNNIVTFVNISIYLLNNIQDFISVYKYTMYNMNWNAAAGNNNTQLRTIIHTQSACWDYWKRQWQILYKLNIPESYWKEGFLHVFFMMKCSRFCYPSKCKFYYKM